MNGTVFNLATPDERTACLGEDDLPEQEGETAVERALRHARERGGFTVRASELAPPPDWAGHGSTRIGHIADPGQPDRWAIMFVDSRSLLWRFLWLVASLPCSTTSRP
ncbi:hypothetical protein [Gordonia sp. NPDC003585]|uniref:hypothetical protein n=1 Tax=Gordonia sp. NPDC003585 TaxID=3154275 RepID=UPI0033B25DA4